MEPLDLALLDQFQRDLPLVPQPFAAMGRELGLSEAQVIARLTRLQAEGKLARVGATVRPNTAGASTLLAMAVPPARLEAVATLVCAEPGINHAYQREDAWNLWCVATAANGAELHALLHRLRHTTGLALLDLRLVQPFNIDLGFPLTGAARAMPAPRPLRPLPPEAGDRALLHALSQGLPLVPRPFATLGPDETATRHRIAALLAAGIITRLGLILRHRALGFTANAMVVWHTDAIALAGPALAAHPGVTLAYERVAVPGLWPYRLYAMIHARSRPEALAVLEGARALPGLRGADHRVLFSTRCFKQTGAQLRKAA